MNAVHKLLFCIAMVIGCLSSINAQQSGNQNGDWQVWPEVDLSIKLNERASLLSMGTLHFGENVSDLNEVQVGCWIEFLAQQILLAQPGLSLRPSATSRTKPHAGASFLPRSHAIDGKTSPTELVRGVNAVEQEMPCARGNGSDLGTNSLPDFCQTS
jgi:hypothetical protein